MTEQTEKIEEDSQEKEEKENDINSVETRLSHAKSLQECSLNAFLKEIEIKNSQKVNEEEKKQIIELFNAVYG